MKITVNETVSTKKHITIRRSDLIELLALEGISVPDHAEITFHIPGGSDWSNMDLDLDDYTVINVDWTENNSVNYS